MFSIFHQSSNIILNELTIKLLTYLDTGIYLIDIILMCVLTYRLLPTTSKFYKDNDITAVLNAIQKKYMI